MELVFASTNPHKVQEIREILAPFGVRVLGLEGVGSSAPPPVEDATTFEGNARLKAVYYARVLGRRCLADDSGLEVDALAGAPGVHSARYAGPGGTREERDARNREKLIAEFAKLGDVDRSARLVCTLCLADASGDVLFEARGTFDGVLVDEPRCGSGFGYDAHLLLPDVDRTVAELSPSELHTRSHRGKAARALGEWLARVAG